MGGLLQKKRPQSSYIERNAKHPLLPRSGCFSAFLIFFQWTNGLGVFLECLPCVPRLLDNWDRRVSSVVGGGLQFFAHVLNTFFSHKCKISTLDPQKISYPYLGGE